MPNRQVKNRTMNETLELYLTTVAMVSPFLDQSLLATSTFT